MNKLIKQLLVDLPPQHFTMVEFLSPYVNHDIVVINAELLRVYQIIFLDINRYITDPDFEGDMMLIMGNGLIDYSSLLSEQEIMWFVGYVKILFEQISFFVTSFELVPYTLGVNSFNERKMTIDIMEVY